MSTSLSASFATIWARELQESLFTTNVWKPQANFRLESDLKEGNAVKRLYKSRPVPQTYTRYSDVSYGSPATTAETLTVATTPVVPFVISDLDELQSTPKARKGFTDDAVEMINNVINGYYLAEVANAGAVVDDSDLGGTAGNGMVLTTTNIMKTFALAQKKLGRKNVMNYKPGMSNLAANITPDVYQTLIEYVAGRGTIGGDYAGENGLAGQYMGFDLYVHNGGYWTANIYMPTQPTDGDTIVIKVTDATVTFTFKTTIGTTAGNILIGGSNDAAGANLAALINAGGVTSDAGVSNVSLSNDNQSAIYGLSATYTAGTDILALTWRGVGAPVISETFTSANNIVKSQQAISHNLFTVKGAVDMVVAKYPTVEVDKLPDRLSEYSIKISSLFGQKTFVDGARKMVDVKVATDLYA